MRRPAPVITGRRWSAQPNRTRAHRRRCRKHLTCCRSYNMWILASPSRSSHPARTRTGSQFSCFMGGGARFYYNYKHTDQAAQRRYWLASWFEDSLVAHLRGCVELLDERVVVAAHAPTNGVLPFQRPVVMAVLHHEVDGRARVEVCAQVGEVPQHVGVLHDNVRRREVEKHRKHCAHQTNTTTL